MKYDVLMISTCTNDKHIHTLMKSLSENNSSTLVSLIILFQNNIFVEMDLYKTEWLHLVPLYTPSQFNLSMARNICINHVLDNKIRADYVMFPDDDSSFDYHFFKNVLSQVRGNTLIDVYCAGTTVLYRKSKYKDLMIITDDKAAMSVNMIINNETFLKVGLFDSLMGVGAPYGAGEDGDYFLRACKVSKDGFSYSKKLWNFHPATTIKYSALTLKQLKCRYKNYGRGVIYLYCKHRMYVSAVQCVVSGFAGMLIAYCCFNFKLGTARFFGGVYRMLTLLSLLFCPITNKFK